MAVRDTETPRVPFACTQGDYVTHSKNVSNASSCMSVDCKSDRKISSIKPPRLGDFRLLPLQEKVKSYFVGEVRAFNWSLDILRGTFFTTVNPFLLITSVSQSRPPLIVLGFNTSEASMGSTW